MKNEEHPGRLSIRLKGFDYAKGGGFYISTGTLRREYLFGEIAGVEMNLNGLERNNKDSWQAIPEHFPNTDVNVFMVMPNQLHGIIMIQETVSTMPIIYRVRHASPPPAYASPAGSPEAIIGSLNSSVTRQAGKELNSGLYFDQPIPLGR